MSVPGLLTCIGFPGWGPLQLLIPAPATPASFARRLRQALEGGGVASAPGSLLPALLRTQKDLIPLSPRSRGRGWARPRERSIGFHYRLVCLAGNTTPVRITTWVRAEEEHWRLLWGSMPMGRFLAAVGRRGEERVRASTRIRG